MKMISAGYFRQAFNTSIYDSKRVSQKWKQPNFEIRFCLFPYWQQAAGILWVNLKPGG
jgi:hypothetical protein